MDIWGGLEMVHIWSTWYMVSLKDTYRTDSTTGDKKCTRRFECPQIGNGTSKERWTIEPL
eukprot:COSAG01_NODE_15895_length_1287_cov_3.062290_2_plen_59_part_01